MAGAPVLEAGIDVEEQTAGGHEEGAGVSLR